MAPRHLEGVSSNLTQAVVFVEDQSDLLPREGDVVTVEVSSVSTPSFFYVILPWGPHTIQEVTNQTEAVKDYMDGETLNSLSAAMQIFYRNRRLDSDYSVYSIGEAVAAWSEESGRWLRAKVLDHFSEREKVKVMFVDFGDIVWVDERNLRQLDQQFVPMPPQAVECSLVGVSPPPEYITWPRRTSSEFFKLVDGKSLVAHVKERLPSGRLLVELYDTTQLNEDINIKTVLIQRGLAAPDPAAEVTDTGSEVKDNDSEEGAQDGDVTLSYVPG